MIIIFLAYHKNHTMPVKSQKSQEASEGNTLPEASPLRSRAYVVTLNNYTDDEISKISGSQGFGAEKWIVGKEVGEEGTPHLQCYFRFKNQKTFSSIKALLPRAHIEAAKGNDLQNWTYCAKQGAYQSNWTPADAGCDVFFTNYYRDVVWKPFQSDVLKLINTVPDDRTINWFWEPEGRQGKTFLVKYILWKYPHSVIVQGKANDIFNLILSFKEKKDAYPNIILVNIPRSCIDFVNYSAIEQVKDGCFYSGKYEGGIVNMPFPHVICFANEEPLRFRLSEDRWNIVRI